LRFEHEQQLWLNAVRMPLFMHLCLA